MHALANRGWSRKCWAVLSVGIGLLLTVEGVGTARADQGCLPNTSPLVETGDLAMDMVAGIDRYLTMWSMPAGSPKWHRDFSSTAAYLKSVEPNRAEFARIIGVVDPRQEPTGLQLIATTTQPSRVGGSADYTVDRVRWPVFDGVDAEGLLLQPEGIPVARVIAVPDADWTPEMLVGLTPGVDPACQFARRLAENGCLVVVPALVDRGSRLSGNPSIRMTNIPHREFIYRMAYQMGRHIIGYEVQKVLAAVDCFHSGATGSKLPIGVFGYGEGGLLALYAAAIDQRIDAACVSGYFQSRTQVWAEPVYRNVWSLLRGFDDANIASLVAPRPLVIEAGRGPEVTNTPTDPDGRSQASSGRLVSPPRESVLNEFNRAQGLYQQLKAAGRIRLVFPDDPRAGPGTEPALHAFLAALGRQGRLRPAGPSPVPSQGASVDVDDRQARQFRQLVDYTQRLVRESVERRRQFWSKADASSLDKWRRSCEFYRNYLWDEVIGRCAPGDSINPRSRRIMDNEKWAGYEVVLDVSPDVFAYGILLLPKDIKPGERRPVVVCQHGLEGRPNKVVDRSIESPYKAFGADLADRGYIVFAPQNPYIGGDAFRLLQRKANPLKLSLFSFIAAQHQQILRWLGQQPFVDPKGIAFYGLSYGGKTAMRVPALLPEYCLSICSGDFNEWIIKTTSVDLVGSYMFTYEYEIHEFDMGNTFNYGELAGLIAPRPFMVERGHDDPVGIDEWVSYEYAKVRRLYVKLGIPDLTEIEYFDGRHEIHAVGTFAFLHKHLAWPR